MLVATRNYLFNVYVWVKAFPFVYPKTYNNRAIGLSFLGKGLERWSIITAPYFYYGSSSIKVFKYSKKIIKEFKLC